ncbi:MAG: bifunctional [glutamate--ammonia ligase]-adenylyl-L-tyrosine phosphorylase/[glutamate--ammonia-ligase] adenylyltransferase [Candidatus Competibacterales bacterium]|nr:bifunctional [glutamate--ammonia ligase]-adenylyl-L-tyrosine phosphorylase/[glutamate--ammonia-ligase] adenylyltransferase [Candidatus Competibacterales bacterium]
MADELPLDDLPEPLRDSVAACWNRIRSTAERNGNALPRTPQWRADLARVLAGSEFVAQVAARDPSLLPGPDEAPQPGSYRTHLSERLTDCTDETDLMARLRRFRQREMVRIAWLDLTATEVLDEVLEALSALAEAILDLTLQRLHDWQCERFGVPRDADGTAQRLVVLGMGKLGGRELNFSSDIDLIFAYPRAGHTDGARELDNEVFFRRLGQRLIKVLTEITPDGFVYRVDMRLRPFGEAGPLAASFGALEDYYQTHGRDWERYALIKARVVAGDMAAGERLLELLRPFVYRRYLDYGAFEALRRMKELIAREVERKGLADNVKLGPGGIREIEFIGQTFQLIHGGREPELRVRSIRAVLDYLARSERLARTAVQRLHAAYALLRRTENRLQLWQDRQTHELPTESTARLRLAWSLGHSDWEDFAATLERVRRHVSEQFAQVFAAPQSEQESSGDTWIALWEGALDEDQARTHLDRQGFDDPAAALQSLQRLHASFSYRALGAQGRERLRRLLPLLLEAVTGTGHPALTLDRVTQLLEAILRRSAYLALLLESPVALSQLVQLCAASPWIAHYLTRHPLLLDELLNPASLYRPLDRDQLTAALDEELARVADGDEEQTLEALRHFQQSSILRVAAADIGETIPLMVVSDHLTEIAEVLLEKVLDLARDDMVARYGRPRCRIDGEDYVPGLAIIGYGKLGGIELGYGSDLDLVFLHDSRGERQETDGGRSLDNASFFAKLVQRIIHLLSTRTPSGILYEVDTRLRPSGRAGLLVSSLGAFADYQREQAWTWEHQALVRARCIAGSPALAEAFAELRRDILCRPRDPDALRREVHEMRERMRRELDKSGRGRFHLKQGPGGIIDIEFLVQYLVLAHAREHPELVTHSDNIRQIDALQECGLLSDADAEALRESYRRLRRRSHQIKLQETASLVDDGEFCDERQQVRRLWDALLTAPA